jgi:hypothetical protein
MPAVAGVAGFVVAWAATGAGRCVVTAGCGFAVAAAGVAAAGCAARGVAA